MSILRTLNTGASGLASNGDALDVVGDNIANANTIGFKRSRANFQDLVASSSGNEKTQIGSGSRIGSVQQMFTSGTLLSTGVSTDLAIAGDGFFVVSGNAGGVEGDFYTRAGQFQINKDGYLVNPDSLRLQGYQANNDGTISNSVGDVRIGPAALPASATKSVNLSANLGASEEIMATFDPADPSHTSNHPTTVTMYDSRGQAHEATVYFNKTSDTTWDYHVLVDGAEVGAPGAPFEGASGTLTFDTKGALTDEAVTVAGSFDFVGADPAQAITFDFGTNINTDGGTGMDGTTSYASATNTNGISQDGYSAGTPSGVTVDEKGVITGTFSNGQRRTLGQVAVAAFRAPDGLARAGGNLWTRNNESGEALMGKASSAGRGSLSSGNLEQSNVDIGREFVDLIAFQRGFQANSKVVQTADELYGELVNLKR